MLGRKRSSLLKISIYIFVFTLVRFLILAQVTHAQLHKMSIRYFFYSIFFLLTFLLLFWLLIPKQLWRSSCLLLRSFGANYFKWWSPIYLNTCLEIHPSKNLPLNVDFVENKEILNAKIRRGAHSFNYKLKVWCPFLWQKVSVKGVFFVLFFKLTLIIFVDFHIVVCESSAFVATLIRLLSSKHCLNDFHCNY